MYAIGGGKAPTIISQGNRYIAPPNIAAKVVRAWRGVAWRAGLQSTDDGYFFFFADHQALRGRGGVEELGVAHGGRPVHERSHLRAVGRGGAEADQQQRVGEAQARDVRDKAHALLGHIVLLHEQAVLIARRRQAHSLRRKQLPPWPTMPRRSVFLATKKGINPQWEEAKDIHLGWRVASRSSFC